MMMEPVPDDVLLAQLRALTRASVAIGDHLAKVAADYPVLGSGEDRVVAWIREKHHGSLTAALREAFPGHQ